MKTVVLAMLIAAGVIGCSTPPLPVVPDGSGRKPVNSDARIADYRARSDEEAAAATHRSALSRQVLALQGEIASLKSYVAQLSAVAAYNSALEPRRAEPPASAMSQAGATHFAAAKGVMMAADSESYEIRPGAVVFRVAQPFAKAEFNPSPAFERELVRIARMSDHIEIRGRTDAGVASTVDRAIAQNRAAKAKSFLLANGVDATKIRVSFLARGGYVVDNATPAGRALNRRVEIETSGIDTSPLLEQVAVVARSQ